MLRVLYVLIKKDVVFAVKQIFKKPTALKSKNRFIFV